MSTGSMPYAPPVRSKVQVRPHGRSLRLLGIVCGLAVTIFTNAGTAQESSSTSQGEQKVRPAASTQPIPAPRQELPTPSASLPLDQVQPGALKVSFDDNQLTIVADNSTLSEILAAVHTRTGAEVDVPPSASGERIPTVRLGPGPAGQVLASLLSWTDFDYVIQASDTDPLKIQSVLLLARSKTPVTGPTGSLVASVRPPRGSPARGDTEASPIPTQVVEAENPVPPQAENSAEEAPAAGHLGSAPPDVTPSQPAARSTEQMIQDLQRLYQQRRQQMQQQSPKPPSGT